MAGAVEAHVALQQGAAAAAHHAPCTQVVNQELFATFDVAERVPAYAIAVPKFGALDV